MIAFRFGGCCGIEWIAERRRGEDMADILRIRIARKWTADEFAELFSQVQFLADVALFSQLKIDGQTPIRFLWRRRSPRRQYFDSFVDAEEELKDDYYLRRADVREVLREYTPNIRNDLEIRRLQFASPGLADLAGVGKVVEQVRIFLTDIMDRYLHSKDRELARQAAAQEILARKIRNAEALLKLGDKVGLDPESKRLLVSEVLSADYFLEGKVISGQVTAIESPAE